MTVAAWQGSPAWSGGRWGLGGSRRPAGGPVLAPGVGSDADLVALQLLAGPSDGGFPFHVGLLGTNGQLHVPVLPEGLQVGLDPGWLLGEGEQVDRFGDAQLAGLEHHDDVLGQLEDAGVLGDLRLADAEPLGEAALAEQLLVVGAIAVERLLVGKRLLQGRQVLPAFVLTAHGGQAGGVVIVADLDRDHGAAGELGRLQPAVAEHQLVPAVDLGADDQALQDALRPDGLGQLGEVAEVATQGGAGVVGRWVNLVGGQVPNVGRNGGHGCSFSR